jgi:hypothetical protein
MKLDSVLELKEKLRDQVTQRLSPLLPDRSALASVYSLEDERIIGPDGPEIPAAKPTIATGIKRVGQGDYRLVVMVQDRKLKNAHELIEIRKEARGEVEIQHIGRAKALISCTWCQQRHRPLRMGASVAHHLKTAGTLTCFVRPRGQADGPIMILSNNHVLALKNSVTANDSTIQPGRHDKGKHPDDRIGELYVMKKLSRTNVNYADGAVSRLDNEINFDYSEMGDGVRLKGVRSSFDDLNNVPAGVRKIGRSTGKTTGRIVATNVYITVDLDGAAYDFDQVIKVEPEAGDAFFSRPGDSGSLVVDSNGEAVGVVFAGTDYGTPYTYLIPIQSTLDRLSVELA